MSSEFFLSHFNASGAADWSTALNCGSQGPSATFHLISNAAVLVPLNCISPKHDGARLDVSQSHVTLSTFDSNEPSWVIPRAIDETSFQLPVSTESFRIAVILRHGDHFSTSSGRWSVIRVAASSEEVVTPTFQITSTTPVQALSSSTPNCMPPPSTPVDVVGREQKLQKSARAEENCSLQSLRPAEDLVKFHIDTQNSSSADDSLPEAADDACKTGSREAAFEFQDPPPSTKSNVLDLTNDFEIHTDHLTEVRSASPQADREQEPLKDVSINLPSKVTRDETGAGAKGGRPPSEKKADEPEDEATHESLSLKETDNTTHAQATEVSRPPRHEDDSDRDQETAGSSTVGEKSNDIYVQESRDPVPSKDAEDDTRHHPTEGHLSSKEDEGEVRDRSPRALVLLGKEDDEASDEPGAGPPSLFNRTISPSTPDTELLGRTRPSLVPSEESETGSTLGTGGGVTSEPEVRVTSETEDRAMSDGAAVMLQMLTAKGGTDVGTIPPRGRKRKSVVYGKDRSVTSTKKRKGDTSPIESRNEDGGNIKVAPKTSSKSLYSVQKASAKSSRTTSIRRSPASSTPASSMRSHILAEVSPQSTPSRRKSSRTLHSTTRRTAPCVIFSSTTTVDGKKKIMETFRSLGGSVAQSIKTANMLCVSDGPLKKTTKFVIAVALGKDIVTEKWLVQCHRDNKLLDHTLFVPKDAEHEREWNFILEAAIARGKEGLDLLSGTQIYFTRQLKIDLGDNFKEFRHIAEILGADDMGVGLPRSQGGDRDVIVIGVQNDPDVIRVGSSGHRLYNKDLLVMGVLRGTLDFESGEFLVEVPVKDEEDG